MQSSHFLFSDKFNNLIFSFIDLHYVKVVLLRDKNQTITFNTRHKTRECEPKGKGHLGCEEGEKHVKREFKTQLRESVPAASPLFQTLQECQEAVRDILKFYRAFYRIPLRGECRKCFTFATTFTTHFDCCRSQVYLQVTFFRLSFVTLHVVKLFLFLHPLMACYCSNVWLINDWWLTGKLIL